jgi:hypothetical protein
MFLALLKRRIYGNTSFTVMTTSAISAALVFGTSGESLAYCLKPSPPYRPWSFNSNQQVDSYNREVDRYNRDIDQYRQCANRQIEAYNRQYEDYLRCEARNYGNNYSSCFKPSPPRF